MCYWLFAISHWLFEGKDRTHSISLISNGQHLMFSGLPVPVRWLPRLETLRYTPPVSDSTDEKQPAPLLLDLEDTLDA